MPSPRERTPKERETLIFATPEEAQEWRGEVESRVKEAQRDGVDRRREVVSEAVATQFAGTGESVRLIREPWLHTSAEHQEAQELVDLAFARDLPAAVRKARQSSHYPRNLDLFHDVLTGQMYHLVQQEGLHRQPVVWKLALVGLVLVIGLGIIAFIWWSV